MKYENGDKVKCIYNYNDNNLSITINKIYGIIKDYGEEILIINDKGIECLYLKDRFELYKEKDEIMKEIKQKWIFNLKQFKNEDISINCESKEEAEKLFDILIINGIEKSEMDTMEYNYNSKTCYDFEDGKMYYGSIGYYNSENYKIYKFSEIDFSNCWNKKSIDDVALHNKVEELDITKLKYITRYQLSLRGFKTGDVLFDGTSMGIVYTNKVLHINNTCAESLIPKAFDYILPIELIESNLEIQKLLLGKLSGKVSQSYLIDYFIKIEEEPKLKTICSVIFTSSSNTTKEFILEEDNSEIEIGDILECCIGSAYQYGRVVDIIQKELTEHEMNTYKKCRKLSQ